MTWERSEKSKDDWATGELQRAVCNLTANLLRIMAGAGRPFDLKRQLTDVMDGANKVAARNTTMGWHASDNAMSEALHFEYRGSDDEADLEDSIVRSALRVAACKLLGEHPSSAFNRAASFQDDLHRYVELKQSRRRAKGGAS